MLGPLEHGDTRVEHVMAAIPILAYGATILSPHWVTLDATVYWSKMLVLVVLGAWVALIAVSVVQEYVAGRHTWIVVAISLLVCTTAAVAPITLGWRRRLDKGNRYPLRMPN